MYNVIKFMEVDMDKNKVTKTLFSSCNNTLKAKLEEYIFEGKDVVFNKNELSKIKFFNASLYKELDIFNKNKTLKKGNDLELVKRILKLGYEYVPNKLISEMSNYEYRYTLYKNLKFSKEFILEDMNYYLNNTSFKNVLTNYFYFDIEISKKIPDILDDYINSDFPNKNNKFILSHFSRLAPTSKENLENLEKYTLEILCQIFGGKRIKNILKYDLNLEELSNIVDENIISTNRDSEILDFTLEIFEYLYEKKVNVMSFLELLHILNFQNNSFFIAKLNGEKLFNYIDNSKLPLIHKIMYMYVRNDLETDFIYIKQLIVENQKESAKNLKRVLEESLELATIMLGILISVEYFSKEEKAYYIDMFKSKIKENIANLEDMDNEEIEIEVLNSIGYMLSYSKDIKEQIKALVQHYRRKNRDILEFINLASCYERLVHENSNENIWEILKDDVGIDAETIIINTLKFVTITSVNSFINFLENNLESAYSIIKSKKLRENEFIELISFLEDSSLFDISILLEYLSLKNKIIVDFVISLLESKKELCELQLEKLLNGRDKIAKKNAEILKKKWKSMHTFEFSTLTELKEYVDSEFIKIERKVLYPELEAYCKVREKDSENFIDSDIIKFFITSYLMKDKIEKFKMEKEFIKFFNLNDLRISTIEIFNHWKRNKPSQNQVGLLQLIASIGTDFEIYSLLNFSLELYNKRNISFLSDVIFALLEYSRKIFTIFLQYSKANPESMPPIHLLLNTPLATIIDNDFADNSILDLGFDKNGEKVLNFGQREIKLVLDKNFSLTIINQLGKQVKTFPKYSEKFKDIEERVLFYTNDIKSFNKKLNILLEEHKKTLFFYMIADKRWTAKTWNEMLENNFFTRNLANKIIWEIRNKNDIIPCYYDNENNIFIDLINENPCKNYEEVRIFFSGEHSNSTNELLKKAVEKRIPILFIEQFIFKNTEFSAQELKQYSFINFHNKTIDFYEATILSRSLPFYFIKKADNSFDLSFIDRYNLNTYHMKLDDLIFKNGSFFNKFDEMVTLEKINYRFILYTLTVLEKIILN